MTTPWRKIDSNGETHLWEATADSGVVIRATGERPPPAWFVEHQARRYITHAPDVELGATGCRVRMPDEKEWRTYSYTPRVP